MDWKIRVDKDIKQTFAAGLSGDTNLMADVE